MKKLEEVIHFHRLVQRASTVPILVTTLQVNTAAILEVSVHLSAGAVRNDNAMNGEAELAVAYTQIRRHCSKNSWPGCCVASTDCKPCYLLRQEDGDELTPSTSGQHGAITAGPDRT